MFFGVCNGVQLCRLIDIVCGYLSIILILPRLPGSAGQLIDACNQIKEGTKRPVQLGPEPTINSAVVFIHVVADVDAVVVVVVVFDSQMHLGWRWLATTMMTLHV